MVSIHHHVQWAPLHSVSDTEALHLYAAPPARAQLHPACFYVSTELVSVEHTWRYNSLGRHCADHRLLQRTGLIDCVNRVYSALRWKKTKSTFFSSIKKKTSIDNENTVSTRNAQMQDSKFLREKAKHKSTAEDMRNTFKIVVWFFAQIFKYWTEFATNFTSLWRILISSSRFWYSF